MGIVTNRKILQKIHDLYASEWETEASIPLGTNDQRKVYWPIDIERVAKSLDMNPHELFGRLYYDIDRRYGYVREDDARVPIFTPRIGPDKHAVHFPYLAGVLAELKDEHWYTRKGPLLFSAVSLVVAFVALALS